MMKSNRLSAIVGISSAVLVLAAGLLIWQSGRPRPVVPAAVAAAVVSGAPAAPAAPAAPIVKGAAATVEDNLQLVIGGMPQPYAQRHAVPLSGDLMAEFALVNGDARYQRVADIYIYSGTRDKPFDDAKVKVTCEMRYMSHGYYTWVADPAGDGHYLLPMPFNMPGEWKLTFQFDGGAKPSQVVLNLDLFY